MAHASVVTELRGDNSKLKSALSESEGMIGTFGKAAAGVFAAIAASRAFGFIKDQVADAFAGAMKQQGAEAKLAASIKATGGAAGFTLEQMKALADQMAATTLAEDDVALGAADVLTQFKNIKGDIFKDALFMTADMADSVEDLSSSARELGKALNDPDRGVMLLERSGRGLTDSQKELIKSLMETGDVAGAQRVILDELQSMYGGKAAAAADTFGGRLQQLRKRFGEATEEIAEAFIPALEDAIGPAERVIIAVENISHSLAENIREWLANADAIKGDAVPAIEFFSETLLREFTAIQLVLQAVDDHVKQTVKNITSLGGLVSDETAQIVEGIAKRTLDPTSGLDFFSGFKEQLEKNRKALEDLFKEREKAEKPPTPRTERINRDVKEKVDREVNEKRTGGNIESLEQLARRIDEAAAGFSLDGKAAKGGPGGAGGQGGAGGAGGGAGGAPGAGGEGAPGAPAGKPGEIGSVGPQAPAPAPPEPPPQPVAPKQPPGKGADQEQPGDEFRGVLPAPRPGMTPEQNRKRFDSQQRIRDRIARDKERAAIRAEMIPAERAEQDRTMAEGRIQIGQREAQRENERNDAAARKRIAEGQARAQMDAEIGKTRRDVRAARGLARVGDQEPPPIDDELRKRKERADKLKEAREAGTIPPEFMPQQFALPTMRGPEQKPVEDSERQRMIDESRRQLRELNPELPKLEPPAMPRFERQASMGEQQPIDFGPVVSALARIEGILTSSRDVQIVSKDAMEEVAREIDSVGALT